MAKGTKVKVSGIALVVPLAPPRLDDISHDALVEWRKRRTEYEDQVATRCASTKEDASALLVPVKSTMDRRVLETLCKYEWGTTVEEISEGELNEKLLGMVRGVKNDTLPDVDALFERLLHMDLHESDVKARVIKYFGKCDDIISQHGLVSVFETAQGSKEKCTQLRARLSPKALHDAVENAIRFTDPDAKTKPTTLYKLVLAKALEQEREHTRVGGTATRKCDKEKRQTDVGDHTKPDDAVKVEVNASPQRATQVAGQKRVRLIECYHCQGEHHVNDCPTADEETKTRLWSTRRRQWSTQTAHSRS